MSYIEDKIARLQGFSDLISDWEATGSDDARTSINKLKKAVQRDVVEAGCHKTLTISPPPAVGGMIMRNVNPFDLIFEQLYLQSFNM